MDKMFSFFRSFTVLGDFVFQSSVHQCTHRNWFKWKKCLIHGNTGEKEVIFSSLYSTLLYSTNNVIHRSCMRVHQPQNHNSSSSSIEYERASFVSVCVRACVCLFICLFVCWCALAHDDHQLWDYIFYSSPKNVLIEYIT